MASQQQSSAASGSPNSKGMSVMSGVNMSGGAASMHHASQMQPQRKLHSIDEAWNLPIPAELTSRRRVSLITVLSRLHDAHIFNLEKN